MRKFRSQIIILAIGLSLIIFYSAAAISSRSEALILTEPSACPSSGCAAGQRLNFLVEYAVNPNTTLVPNTQICVYAPTTGKSLGSDPWVDFTNGWISGAGIISGNSYSRGQTSAVCSSQTDAGNSWITGAYATLTKSGTDQLQFALNIHPAAEINGSIKVKVFQINSDGATWTQTNNFSQYIPVAPAGSTAYVALTATECGSNTPCYINSSDDSATGLGTGLRDAVNVLKDGDEIVILKDYFIKDQAVLIDKAIRIRGHEKALLSTNGMACEEPMLILTRGVKLSDLTINDGNCSIPSSRDLIKIDSASEIQIEHNTLQSGKIAINILDNSGDVTVAFNQIINNQEHGVFRESGTLTSGYVNIFANNIMNNGDEQVLCNNLGAVDHNYWGKGISPTETSKDCLASSGKELGAPILLSTSGAGVEAVRQTVRDTLTYAFNNKIGVRHTASASDFDVIIVNHGQGGSINVPFYQKGTGAIQACSNFYDVFLADDAFALNLDLVLKYDLNEACITTIESSEYCNQADSSKYPLWWYDPANQVTDGWNRTGQPPQGTGAGGATGQTTVCNMAKDEVMVSIDTSGRPGILSDLNFTPFVVGLPIVEGVKITQFTATFDVTKVNLKWITSSETNVQGFYVLRSETEAGPYTRISSQIDAIGDDFIGAIYNYTDANIDYKKSYYYKIQVINNEGAAIQTVGPASVMTSTLTPTVTLTATRTPTSTPYKSSTPYPTRTFYPTSTRYPTRTSLPIYYRTPTPNYLSSTSTPFGAPTAVRTYGPSPTSNYPDGYDPTHGFAYPDYESGYPSDDITETDDGYPSAEEDNHHEITPTPALDETRTSLPPDVEQTPTTPTPEVEKTEETPPLRWIFILIGSVSAMSALLAASLILIKTHIY